MCIVFIFIQRYFDFTSHKYYIWSRNISLWFSDKRGTVLVRVKAMKQEGRAFWLVK